MTGAQLLRGRVNLTAASSVLAALALTVACSGSSSHADSGPPADAARGGSSAGNATSGGVGSGGKSTGGTPSSAGKSGAGGSTQAGAGGASGSAQAGKGGVAAAGESAGGEGPTDCGSERILTDHRYAQRGRSAGFSGTEDQYNELYELPACSSAADCVMPCAERGGSSDMCGAMACVMSDTSYCEPPSIWTNLNTLSAEGMDIYSDAAELVLWSNPYNDFLLADHFKLEIPDDAEVSGVMITVRHAGGGPGEAVDKGVRIIKNGAMGKADRSSPTPWDGPELANVDYGDSKDLWGETWTPADLNADDFGVALSAAYTQTAGNGRAYVDIVYVTVSYTVPCTDSPDMPR